MGGADIRRGLSTDENLRFKIDWASLIVESKFTVLALFYFVFEGNFPSTSPRGAYIWRDDFCVTGLEGLFLEELIDGGAYIRNFTVPSPLSSSLIDDTFFFTLILAVIFSWSCESAAFMSCNLLLHLLVSVTSTFCYLPQGILSFFLLYFSNSLIIHKENTKEVNV